MKTHRLVFLAALFVQLGTIPKATSLNALLVRTARLPSTKAMKNALLVPRVPTPRTTGLLTVPTVGSASTLREQEMTPVLIALQAPCKLWSANPVASLALLAFTLICMIPACHAVGVNSRTTAKALARIVLLDATPIRRAAISADSATSIITQILPAPSNANSARQGRPQAGVPLHAPSVLPRTPPAASTPT